MTGALRILPEHYYFTNRVFHYLYAVKPPRVRFLTGDWVESLHDDDLQELRHALNALDVDAALVREDIDRACQELFLAEMGLVAAHLRPRAAENLRFSLLQAVQVEILVRQELILRDRRMSIAADGRGEPHLTRRGQALLAGTAQK
ncbi:hypothetical protein F6X40_10915 [Paraburkholderia sp. UCT31]|uniref:hypothetical protein n=1 Tax=Paraburkholderia sp. UCT31 TaxID=2615209 RepID=UPI001654CCBA|nr:hypothetical protein [Paraburkholderia sp. UCT31]MBC8737318.1 hypothetical protein [Paraburkholderia sp. UCT31]